MTEPLNSFDELSVGQRFAFGTIALGQDEIIEYARRFDPQPFHLDPEAARNAPLFGGLVASGLHTMGACFGRVMGTGIFSRISLGGSGIDTRWPAPLRPGEEFALVAEVLELRASRSRPEMGIAVLRYTGTRVSDGAVVIEMTGTHFLKR